MRPIAKSMLWSSRLVNKNPGKVVDRKIGPKPSWVLCMPRVSGLQFQSQYHLYEGVYGERWTCLESKHSQRRFKIQDWIRKEKYAL